MRILFLTDNFPPETNAPANRTWEHVRVWVAEGHEVTVITGAPNFPAGKVFAGYTNAWRKVEEIDGIRVVRVKTYIAANAGTVRRLIDYLSFMFSATFFALFEKRPDIIVATSPQFFTAVAGFLTGLLRGRPWVFELRDLWPESVIAVGAMRPGLALRLVERLELVLYRRARTVISVTHAFRANLINRGIDGAKIKVVTNGVDQGMFSDKADGTRVRQAADLAGQCVFGYVGTHGMAHALDTVIAAAVRLQDRTDIAFLFVGDGSERARLEAQAASLPNVRFLPPQPRERMAEVWSACDVALVTLQDRETFRTVIPSKIFEAMSMGLPILMSLPDGEATGILQNHNAGMTCLPEDDKALAEAVRYLAENVGIRAQYGDNGRQAAADYDRTTLARKMLSHLENAAQIT